MRTFRDFMESALYDPERGFYSSRAHTADFYTAPELNPAFGLVLADRLAVLLRRVRATRPTQPLTLVEAGCGDGTLAAQVIQRLRAHHADLAADLRLVLIDRSRRDLTTAARRLTAFGLPTQALTTLAALPSVTGVLYSNELCDAFPAHLLQKDSGKMREVYVAEDGQEVLGDLSDPDLTAPAAAMAPALAEGERHAVSLEASRWLKQAAIGLDRGFLLTIDYGKRFTPETPNAPRAYRAHRPVRRLTASPGAQDLTVPTDFSALITAGETAGMALESYQTLSSFLIDGGIASFFGTASYAQRLQLKTLVHPEGMGDAFKVLIQRKGL